jgi:hypothetical protein
MENFSRKIDEKKIALGIIFLGIVISGLIIYFKGGVQTKVSPVLTSQKAGEKIVRYINENLLQEGMGEVTLINSEENGKFLYKLNLSVGGQSFEVYTTRDGRFLFFQAPLNTEEPFQPPLQ